MKNPAQTVLALIILMAALTGPATGELRTDPMGGTGGGPIAGFLHVQVVHEGTSNPFPGAFVMVGPRDGVPFPGNWGFASETGEISFADANLQGPVCITAGAAGYAYFTLVSVNANDLVLPLSPISNTPTTYQVGDNVSGIDVNNGTFHLGDGYLDMAFVMPTLQLQTLMSFDMQSLLGPPETIDILGQSFEVPSNIFIPQQWELLVEIIKDHYYLYLEAGDYTLVAMSGRVPRDELLNSGDIVEVIPLIDWREIDILDVTVSGITFSADLNVDPDLNETVTLNLANIPENSVTWCFSAGDLDHLGGLGRLVPLGLTSFDCPGGSGPCAGSVTLTTAAATGEFAGMTYFPAAAVQLNDTEDMLVLLRREPHGQSYTETMSSFFRLLDLAYDTGTFMWNDAENPATGSPPVHVQMARIASVDTGENYWEFMIPGGVLSFGAPSLPAAAPPGPQPGSVYRWAQVAFGLGYDLPVFDFNAFAFSDIFAHGSHIAGDQTDIVFVSDPASIASGASPGVTLQLAGHPNPFRGETTIAFELASAAPTDLAIFTPDGRRVRTLGRQCFPAGPHTMIWQGTDERGVRVPSGVYLARLVAPGVRQTWRLVLQR